MKNQKLVALLMAASVLAVAITGCGNESPGGQSSQVSQSETAGSVVQSSSGAAADSEEAIPNFHEEGYPIVDEEVTIKIMFGEVGNLMVSEADEMPAIQRLEELTGVNIEMEIIDSDWDTKFNMMVASGEYPDIIMRDTWNAYEEYGVVQKVFIPVEDLIEKYIPNFTEPIAREESDPTRHLIASDGHMYTVPMVNLNGTYNMGSYPFINVDWLEAMNLPMPQSIEELTEVLRAFKTGDPNGNGEADEIPYMETLADKAESLQMFGVNSHSLTANGGWLLIDEDKKVQLSAVQDGVREWLDWMHLLYEEELVDPEIFTLTTSAYRAKLDTGNAGFMMTARKYALAHDGIAESIEMWMPEEENYFFARKYQAGRPHTYITSQCEHPEVAARLINAFLEKETAISLYYGEQDATEDDRGWRYLENGKVETYSLKTSNDVVKRLDSSALVCFPAKTYQEVFHPAATLLEGYEYRDNLVSKDAWATYSNQLLNYVQMSEEDKETVDLIAVSAKAAIEEFIFDSVQNGVTDESWNNFKKTLDDMGMPRVLEIYQNALDQSGL